jgi:hypothetical protein
MTKTKARKILPGTNLKTAEDWEVKVTKVWSESSPFGDEVYLSCIIDKHNTTVTFTAAELD